MKACIYTNSYNISDLLTEMDYTITYIDISRFSAGTTYYEIKFNNIESETLFTLKYSNNVISMYDTFTVYKFT